MRASHALKGDIVKTVEELLPPAQTVDPRSADPRSALSDSEVVVRVRAGERALFEILMRRHNQKLYRAVRAILKDERDVEDVMQQAYVNAFVHLHQFEDRSRFSTWLIRIALNEAFARQRRMRLADPIPSDEDGGEVSRAISSREPDPERQAYAQELRVLLEQAIEALPESYRLVFMLRVVEGLSTSETGEGLGLGDEVIKTRLHRARAMLRRSVTARLGDAAPSAFPFHASRCNRVVTLVFDQLLDLAASPDGWADWGHLDCMTGVVGKQDA
jgi:RNA polymerase sigma-70 factor (ECF subfamily)